MPLYRKVGHGTLIDAPGGKRIEEFFGAVHTHTDAFSLARMHAPAGWSEPAQRPRFGEITLMLRGRLHAEVEGEAVEVGPGEALWVEPGSRVRYANLGNEPADYWAICIPAFTPQRAGREA